MHEVVCVCGSSTKSSHKYEGEFKNGCFDGFGVFTRSDGMKYEGEFYAGNITGSGENCIVLCHILVSLISAVTLIL